VEGVFVDGCGSLVVLCWFVVEFYCDVEDSLMEIQVFGGCELVSIGGCYGFCLIGSRVFVMFSFVHGSIFFMGEI
jgi:hypothetical protein